MNREVNRQAFSLNLGLFIMAFHIILSLAFWFLVAIPGDRVAIKEISTPVTIGYAVAVLKYFLDVGGRVTATETIGIRLVIMITGVVTVFGVCLIVAPMVYLQNPGITPETLNSFFVAVESAFGALLALIFSYLYKMPA